MEGVKISTPPFSCLAIETATELPSVALLTGGQLALRETRGLQSPSRGVYTWVSELLGETGTELRQLDCIAFGCGPGSFTGVRVAVSLAQGLGYACNLPVCPVSTLAVLAAGALRETGAEAVVCCLDARMGEVYLGIYARDSVGGVRALRPDTLLKPEEVCLPDGITLLAVGPGWAAHPQLSARLASRFIDTDGDLLPSATQVLHLARPLFLAGRVVSAGEAVPNYLRNRVTSIR